jgi:anti-sigma factor RsiW
MEKYRGILRIRWYNEVEAKAMSCQKYQKDLSALLDRELRGRDKERLEAHLTSCEECARMWRQMSLANERVRNVGAYAVDERALTNRIKARLASRAGARRGEQSLVAWRQVPVFALLVLIALGMGNFAGRSLVDVLFPTADEPITEAQLLENGSSFGDVFMDLTSASSGERNDR